MKLLKVGSGVVNQTPMDWEQNKANLVETIEAAKEAHVDILCLPELAITAYGCEDAFHSPNLCEQAIESLLDIKEHCVGMIVCVGLPLSFNSRLYNTACLIANRQILGFVCKQHLPNYGIFYEDRWFQRWPAGQKSVVQIGHQTYPIGDLLFEIDGIRIGIEICEDAWVPQRPGEKQFRHGVDIILNPSASPFEFFKFQTRERLIIESSRMYNCTYIYANLLGNEAGRLIFDGDAQIASNGQLLASSPRFSYANHTLTTAIVDLETALVDAMKIKTRGENIDNLIRYDYALDNDHAPVIQEAELEPFEKGGFLKEEEFARGVCLALFDYLRKSRSQGFTISLSGGADSSSIAALCGLMIRLGDESIGLEAFKNKLAHIAKIQEKETVEDIGREIIYTIYQGTENSSDETRNSARALAESVGAKFYSIEINELVAQYTQLIEEQIDRKLTWENDDIALQNIQARVRAPSVWLLTNITNNLLLSTSNRSEAAVGYATMDGDTAGSLSPIAGIDKHWLRKWLIWLEKTGCEVKGKHIRIEGLKYVNALNPTAELRPKEFAQTDEKDLMPYEILDAIEKLAIKDKKSPLEAFRYLECQFNSAFSRSQLAFWIKRFYTLWSRNQWKRERYAISFHLDNRNLDPRSWCRFPILSGGFKKELEELEDYLSGLPSKKSGGIGFRQKN
ncbi:NAD(+) synthase [Marinilongibacter aquaticus]|uniref:NAD(+) synthase n=1 Tax=Marinilongibacter aquaticus TaxID=2975157 RepID=UPI0021BDE4CD|nr:NAD(+) synthase [Marinilongibacter aquaticus]UBM60140.1 NAD(+) synthase [Marinilongibacter aquaticus]